MRRRIQTWLYRALMWLRPKPDLQPRVDALSSALASAQEKLAYDIGQARERLSELIEAREMCGPGPWLRSDANAPVKVGRLREAGPASSIGAFGEYDLMLQNVEWKREINYSFLEFSRWGLQSIVLICRLYYLKNPIVRRLVDVCALYVFARGVDVTTSDKDANEVLTEFFERNRHVLGHTALTELEKSKDRDGNLFFAFFSDAANKGTVDVRTVDATEIQEIITDPEDSDQPWFYRRQWSAKSWDVVSGQQTTEYQDCWYPALNYHPEVQQPTIGGKPVMWATPIYHRKVGAVGKWLFGCPRIYPMLGWAKEGRRFLEACASVRQSLSQIAMTLTSKGGQQALEAQKQQLQTTVGPPNQMWDVNPPAIAGSIFGSGPGTKLEAFKIQGATFSPEDVRRYLLMCCMVKGVPETFLGDVSTGNLATATSLDRPTETVMLALQEEWVEDLTVIATYVLSVSLRAPGGRLREACPNPGAIRICEAAYRRAPSGRRTYEANRKQMDDDIEVRVVFPAIREGDVPAMVGATVEAMTLGNKGGQVTGIDEKEGMKILYRLLDIEGGDELAEAQYPDKEYDPDRTKEEIPPPVPKLQPQPGGTQPKPNQVVTAQPGGQPSPMAVQQDTSAPTDASTKEAAQSLRRLAEALDGH